MSILTNARHEKFAQLLAAGTPVGQAYVAAGYKDSPASATRLSKSIKIQARIDELLGPTAARAEITIERTLRELAKIGFADIRQASKWRATRSSLASDGSDEINTRTEIVLMDSDSIPDDVAAAISEVRQDKDGTVVVKMHPRCRPCRRFWPSLSVARAQTSCWTPRRARS